MIIQLVLICISMYAIQQYKISTHRVYIIILFPMKRVKNIHHLSSPPRCKCRLGVNKRANQITYHPQTTAASEHFPDAFALHQENLGKGGLRRGGGLLLVSAIKDVWRLGVTATTGDRQKRLIKLPAGLTSEIPLKQSDDRGGGAPADLISNYGHSRSGV